MISTIPVGTGPVSLISSFSNLEEKGKIYVANFDNNTVSVINASSDKGISTIPVGENPGDIAVNPSTNKIYVANLGSNTVSVISASSDKEISRIPVGENPGAIQASSVFPSLSYVLDKPINHTDTVSVIDDSVEKVAAGVTFNIRPANSGNVWCNNEEYPTNIYLYLVSGTK